MEWREFRHGETVYRLDHLHPFTFELVVPEKDGKPEQRYPLNVIFSLHCFSRSPRPGEAVPPELAYSDNRETRIFCPDRHALSFRLPEIVRTLADRPCFHDTHGNFYVFEIDEADGTKSYYSVFFTLSKAGRKRGLNLYISSAYKLPERPYAHSVKPIRFRVLVHNVWTGKPVKPAPR